MPYLVLAVKETKEEARASEAGEVLKEILNIPDNIPQDLLDKAECVIVLPSVKGRVRRWSAVAGNTTPSRVTKSVASPPNWNPMLSPSSAYIAGGPYGPV